MIEDDEVDQHIIEELDDSGFSESEALSKELMDLLWRKRAVFKGIGCFTSITHRINLKECVSLVCYTLRRRSPKE